MAPILLYHALKATTPFVDASVNKRLRVRQFLPSIKDCLAASVRRQTWSFNIGKPIVEVPPKQRNPPDSSPDCLVATHLNESNIVTLQITQSLWQCETENK